MFRSLKDDEATFISACMAAVLILLTLGYIDKLFLSKEFWISSKEVIVGVVSSVIASLFWYFFFSRPVEPKLIVDISEATAEKAIQQTHKLYHERFADVVPRKCYPRTSAPTLEFRKDFAEALRRSRRYWHAGDTATFASFRLQTLAAHPNMSEKEISVLLLHPDAKAQIEDRARQESSTRAATAEEECMRAYKDIRTKIFITVVALYDVAHLLDINLAFRRNEIMARTEFMDDHVFISYYLGGDFPGSYFYDKGGHAYKAHELSFHQQIKNSELKPNLRLNRSDETISQLLLTLEREHTLSEIRARRDEEHSKILKSLPYTTNDLF